MKHTIKAVTIRDLNYSKSKVPVSIPKGTEIDLYFKEDNNVRAFFMYQGIERPLIISFLHLSVKGKAMLFRKCPSAKSLARMSDEEGVCTTVTGARVEPDGRDLYGAPSWLLVLGLI